MVKKRQMSVRQLANLPQYKGKSDEELEAVQARIFRGSTKERVQDVLEDFSSDYDLSDMNANDELALENLARIFVRLDDLEIQLDTEMMNTDVTKVGRLVKIAADLRKDASQLQQDLAITRKARKGDTEEDLVSYIEDLKSRAKKFLAERLSYVYCPKCQMLVCNVWFLYPDEQRNALRLKCIRTVNEDTDKRCDTEFTVTSAQLKEMRNTNLEGVIPT